MAHVKRAAEEFPIDAPSPKRRSLNVVTDDALYKPLNTALLEEVCLCFSGNQEYIVMGVIADNGNAGDIYKKKVAGKVLLLDSGESLKRERTTFGKETDPERVDLRGLPKRYELYEPLHALWCAYVNELLGNDYPQNVQGCANKLLKADLHGCKMEVSHSRCPSLVGQCGIVVRENANVFVIVTRGNQLKVIPKANTAFFLDGIANLRVTLYGDQFRFRSADRAARKFKARPTIDL